MGMQESDVEEADDGVVWMTDTSAEAVKKRAEEQLTAATAAMVTQGNIEAEQAEERKKARRAAEEEAARAEVGLHTLYSPSLSFHCFC